MNLNPHRPWITPLVIGTFVLMAATGILMFFHLDSGLNKTAHEWLGWALVAAVTMHILLNLSAFKRYLNQPKSRWVLMACTAVLALSFVPMGGSAGGKPPFIAPVQALAKAPLSTVAQVAGTSTTALRAKLGASGLASQSDTQSIQDLVGADLGDQMRALGKAFAVDPLSR